MKTDAEAAWEFMQGILGLCPIFAYAGEYDEQKARNRYKRHFGEMSLETWVGRNFRNAIPGLYWTTCISDALLKRHAVPIDLLKDAAFSYKQDHGCHLFRFYDQPGEWSSADRVKELCVKQNGIFNIDDAVKVLSKAQTLAEFYSLKARWP